MKYLSVIILFSVEAYATNCQAPGQGFLEEKLKESFVTAPAEKELKEVVLDQRNYSAREEIKGLDRRSKYADRIQMREIASVAHQKFDQMIEATGRTEDIMDFPIQGASGRLSGAEDGLVIELNNVSKEDLDVLPPPVLEKLSNKVKIKYNYPYDTYDYFLTYAGRELPLKKAFLKIQADFETACEDRLRENAHTKGLWEQDRKIRGFSNSGSTSQ